jgi:hypothetical protein
VVLTVVVFFLTNDKNIFFKTHTTTHKAKNKNALQRYNYIIIGIPFGTSELYEEYTTYNIIL